MKYLSILLLSFLVACGGGSEEKKEKSEEKDSTETADTNTTDEAEVKEAEENPEEMSIEEYEKANEGGMDFCECVKKAKELDDKMIAAETDAEMEAFMAEKEKLVDNECKVIKMGSQDSPDDRAARKRKIDACLKGL